MNNISLLLFKRIIQILLIETVLLCGLNSQTVDSNTVQSTQTHKQSVGKDSSVTSVDSTKKALNGAICPTCNGSGRVVGACFSCNGSGGIRCSSCNGSGLVYDMKRIANRCSSCGGTGNVRCSYCDGKGREEKQCFSCKGKGRIKS